jgi:4-hydroxybenzoyl-CoA reductase subunit beta
MGEDDAPCRGHFMLRLPPFRYVRPDSVAEAARVLAHHPGEAMVLAGGTDLIPNLKRRQFDARVLVAVGALEKLGAFHANGELVIGGGMKLGQVADLPEVAAAAPGLVQALRQIAHPQIQRQGTIGGNLCVDTRCNYYNQTHEWRESIGFCMKRAGDICLVAPGSSKCWAVSSSDAAPMLMALEARVVLVGAEGERVVPLGALYRDDGIDYLTRRPDEILTRILVPRVAGLRSTYRKVRRRGSFDFPILGVAAALELAGAGAGEHAGPASAARGGAASAGGAAGGRQPRVRRARLVLGAVHTHPVEVEVADLLEGEELTDERIDAVVERAFKAATPLDNADLMYYWRKRMVRVEVRRALRALRDQPGQQAP